MTFTVAIVGRPNVGKSTLFNRLVGKRMAIVAAVPGVTRDRREGRARLGGLRFKVIDTAGLEDAATGTLEREMRAQTDHALAEADIAMLVIDARSGMTPLDSHFASQLRRLGKPVILVANKCEGNAGSTGIAESYALGMGDPVPVSAEHGEGMGDLYDALAPFAGDLDEQPHTRDDAQALQLAIVGRPNVGKSTLVNRLLGKERMLTGAEPGITRDAISTLWNFDGRLIQLVDTAGLRRKAKVTEKLEGLSTSDTLHAIRFAQVVVVVIDAEIPLEKQDLTIASKVIEEGRALVLAVNKWDLIKNRGEVLKNINERLERSLTQVRGLKVVTLSALDGAGVDDLLPTVLDIYDIWNKRIPTAQLNRWLEVTSERHPPPIAGGRRIRLRYITQAKARPPTFIIFSSRAKNLPEAYRRYLINGLRDNLGLDGVPIRLMVRAGKNPYAKS